MLKRCTACLRRKSLSEFNRRTASPDGLRPTCKVCHRAQASAWQAANKDRVRANYVEWTKRNPDRVREISQAYYATNKAKVLQNVSAWRAHKLTTSELYKATKALRNLTSQAFSRSGYKKRHKCNSLLGCDFATAKFHIELQFQPGMSWDNHGDWHIDHRSPLHTASTISGRERLCHYTNFRPLWALDNMRRSREVTK